MSSQIFLLILITCCSSLSVASTTQFEIFLNHGNTDDVNAIAYDPAGPYLATADNSQQIKIIQMNNSDGRVVRVLNYHQEDVVGITYSPDGKWLASVSKDRNLVIFELVTNQLVKIPLDTFGDVGVVKFSPKGRFLYAAMGQTFVKVDMLNGFNKYFYAKGKFRSEEISSMDISLNGKYTAVAFKSGKVKLWKTKNNELFSEVEIKHKLPSVIKFTKGYLAIATMGSKVLAWDYKNASVKYTLKKDQHILHRPQLHYDQYENNLILVNKNKVSIWNASQFNLVKQYKLDSAYNMMGFSFDSKEMVGVDTDKITHSDHPYYYCAEGQTNVIRMSTIDGKKLASYKPGISDSTFTFAELSGDGRVLALTACDGHVQLWDTNTGRQLTTIPAKSVRSIALGKDGSLFATGGPKRYFLFDLKQSKPVINESFSEGYVDKLAISKVAFGQSLVSNIGANNSKVFVRVHNINTGKLIFSENNFYLSIKDLEFINNTHLAITDFEGDIRIFDIKSGKLISTLEGKKTLFSKVKFENIVGLE
ncbi:WD40 repeat domain-containing protein [Spartinivicinus ruber]|uniref:WD40 repeat domain-containing protein n=1 Tax=Spartinivicinus ruber TaxID=2683272 RepID=UPI0013D5D4E3|nr:WD40 repeat domain-containing protein [Spartinivicinus ruber]